MLILVVLLALMWLMLRPSGGVLRKPEGYKTWRGHAKGKARAAAFGPMLAVLAVTTLMLEYAVVGGEEAAGAVVVLALVLVGVLAVIPRGEWIVGVAGFASSVLTAGHRYGAGAALTMLLIGLMLLWLFGAMQMGFGLRGKGR